MTQNEDLFWAALGALTYAELLSVATAIRDVCDPQDFNVSDAYDWAKLMDSAREVVQSEDAA